MTSKLIIYGATGYTGQLVSKQAKQGWGWWYRQYAPGDTVLEGLEQAAREAKKELWADPVPIHRRSIGLLVAS